MSDRVALSAAAFLLLVQKEQRGGEPEEEWLRAGTLLVP